MHYSLDGSDLFRNFRTVAHPGRSSLVVVHKCRCNNVFFVFFSRYRLSQAFFKMRAKCRCGDVFPSCAEPVHKISSLFRGKGYNDDENDDESELTLQKLQQVSPTFISNITVNDWQIDREDKSRHQLMSFSSEGVELIGKGKGTSLPHFRGCFEPGHMRLSASMAISGAAVSFDMGSYESGGLDMVLDLLNLLGIGMGDEMVCDQCKVTEQKASRKVCNWQTKWFMKRCWYFAVRINGVIGRSQNVWNC